MLKLLTFQDVSWQKKRITDNSEQQKHPKFTYCNNHIYAINKIESTVTQTMTTTMKCLSQVRISASYLTPIQLNQKNVNYLKNNENEPNSFVFHAIATLKNREIWQCIQYQFIQKKHGNVKFAKEYSRITWQLLCTQVVNMAIKCLK